MIVWSAIYNARSYRLRSRNPILHNEGITHHKKVGRKELLCLTQQAV